MLFNSLHYLVFFPLAAGLYFLLPQRWRWAWLLACSYYFYMCWRPSYVVILWGVTLVDYLASLQIARSESPARRKLWLTLSLASNIGLLSYFKYFNFFSEAVTAGFHALGLPYRTPQIDVLLPVGISFHTFQAMAYTIDVYRDRRVVERHLGYFALYVAFFPQLVAGPIERVGDLLPQFRRVHRFDAARIASGLRIALWGFFKKVVVADGLAVYVTAVFAQPSAFGGAQLLLALYFFAFQVYCDFSGYTDIAIGSARVMGFDLSPNFARPYASRSFIEFWQRWHISLSTWFRDYLYIPLGGNRVGRLRHYLNLFTVFLVSGLWHGASWTFVIFGALHGLFMVATVAVRDCRGDASRPARSTRLRTALAVLVTFHLFTFSLIFFRSANMADAWAVLRGIAGGIDVRQLFDGIEGFDRVDVALSLLFIGVLEAVLFARARGRVSAVFLARPAWFRWTVYYAAMLTILLFGTFDEREFVYFQF